MQRCTGAKVQRWFKGEEVQVQRCTPGAKVQQRRADADAECKSGAEVQVQERCRCTGTGALVLVAGATGVQRFYSCVGSEQQGRGAEVQNCTDAEEVLRWRAAEIKK